MMFTTDRKQYAKPIVKELPFNNVYVIRVIDTSVFFLLQQQRGGPYAVICVNMRSNEMIISISPTL